MRFPEFRHVAAAGALALIATIPMAACAGPSLSPRPPRAAGTETAAAPSPTPSTTPSASARSGTAELEVARQPGGERPAKKGTGKPSSTSTKPAGSCYGAVRHDLDLQNTELDLVKSMCFHTGGILRLQGIGPGLVTATPESLVSQSYEAGVVDLRFVRPGTVTVTIPQDEKTYTITVVVVS
jgi:hypothetical protein